MRELSIREMREALGRLDVLVEEEGELVVTRHGRALARILPARGARVPPTHRALRESMPRVGIPSEILVRQERDGR